MANEKKGEKSELQFWIKWLYPRSPPPSLTRSLRSQSSSGEIFLLSPLIVLRALEEGGERDSDLPFT